MRIIDDLDGSTLPASVRMYFVIRSLNVLMNSLILACRYWPEVFRVITEIEKRS